MGCSGNRHRCAPFAAIRLAWTLLPFADRLRVASPQFGAVVDTNLRAAKILCIEYDVGLLNSRCDVLKYSGFDTASATPQVAEILLRSRKFDLIVLSRLSDFDLHADGADVLVIEPLTTPIELLGLVAQRLRKA
jgi:hypothetical protein